MEDYLSRYGDHVIRAVRQAWREYQEPPMKTLAQALAEVQNRAMLTGDSYLT